VKRTQHIEIARSPGDVFAYLTDPSRLSTSAVGTRLTFTPIVRLTGGLVRDRPGLLYRPGGAEPSKASWP
jgi:hypothetical protein